MPSNLSIPEEELKNRLDDGYRDLLTKAEAKPRVHGRNPRQHGTAVAKKKPDGRWIVSAHQARDGKVKGLGPR